MLLSVQAVRAAGGAAGGRTPVHAWVEVDAGQARCGATTDDAVISITRAVVDSGPDLEFGGLHVYHGGIQHIRRCTTKHLICVFMTMAAGVDGRRMTCDLTKAEPHSAATLPFDFF
eukprot:SAG31_NODE_11684_length_1007_cov_0.896476_1_plen_116_part_00